MTGAGVRHADRFDLGQLVARDGAEVSEAGYLQFSIPRVETPLVVYARAVELARPLRARTLLSSRCLRPVPAP